MKRLFNLMLAVLFMVMLSACGKPDSSADKVSEQYGQTEDAETTEQAQQEQSAASETIQAEVQTENNLTDEQEQQTQGGDNTVTGDNSFFKTEGDNYESFSNKRQRKKRWEHSNSYQYCV